MSFVAKCISGGLTISSHTKVEIPNYLMVLWEDYVDLAYL